MTKQRTSPRAECARPRGQESPNHPRCPICRMPFQYRTLLRPGTGALRRLDVISRARLKQHFVNAPGAPGHTLQLFNDLTIYPI